MGAYSPAPLVSRDLLNEILDKVIHPMIAGLNKEGITYKGVLYAGIMVTKDGPQALEFNVRMGDPETQAVLPRIKTDFLELMLAASSGDLSSFARPGGMVWDNRACACVVMASGGYPGNYEKGKEIKGLEKVERLQDVTVFHAATKKSGGKYFTNGGRILGVTGLGNTINEALYRAYQAIDEISFEGAHYRKDIGYRAVEKLSGSGKDGKSEK
jgi:phosphoribosylamine--glycine ligase